MSTSVLSLRTAVSAPLDPTATSGVDPKTTISNFLTVQSLTNFATMTGAISAAWHAVRFFSPADEMMWVPFAIAGIWGLVSFVMSLPALKESGKGDLLAAVFIASINSLILASAVVGLERAST